MRVAVGLTPVTRFQNFEKEMTSINRAARATEEAYQNVMNRIRLNEIATEKALQFSTSSNDNVANFSIEDESHRAAAIELQSPEAGSVTAGPHAIELQSEGGENGQSEGGENGKVQESHTSTPKAPRGLDPTNILSQRLRDRK